MRSYLHTSSGRLLIIFSTRAFLRFGWCCKRDFGDACFGVRRALPRQAFCSLCSPFTVEWKRWSPSGFLMGREGHQNGLRATMPGALPARQRPRDGQWEGFVHCPRPEKAGGTAERQGLPVGDPRSGMVAGRGGSGAGSQAHGHLGWLCQSALRDGRGPSRSGPADLC